MGRPGDVSDAVAGVALARLRVDGVTRRALTEGWTAAVVEAAEEADQEYREAMLALWKVTGAGGWTVAAARVDVPALCDEVERLRAALRELRQAAAVYVDRAAPHEHLWDARDHRDFTRLAKAMAEASRVLNKEAS